MRRPLAPLFQFNISSPHVAACRVLVIASVVLAAASPAAMSAQIQIERPTKSPFEISNGSNGPASVTHLGKSANTDTEQDNAKVDVGAAAITRRPNTLSASASRDLMRINQQAMRLIMVSRDAWQRGLLDQASYAAWLDIASTARINVALRRQDRSSIRQAYREQVSLWNEAASRLQALGQPAATGLQADISHANMMALRANFQARVASGESLSRQDKAAYDSLGAQHYRLRLQDFDCGLTNTASVLSAARLIDEKLITPEPKESDDDSTIRIASFQIERPVALQAAVEELHRTRTRASSPLTVSLTASDKVALQRATSVMRFLDEPTDDRNDGAFLEQLGRDAQTTSGQQLANRRSRTATAGGMLRSWWQYESLAGMATQEDSRTSFQESQELRLQQIRQFALATRDLRGRNSADVAAAETIWAIRQLGSVNAD